jgi:hypothetical protein
MIAIALPASRPFGIAMIGSSLNLLPSTRHAFAVGQAVGLYASEGHRWGN